MSRTGRMRGYSLDILLVVGGFIAGAVFSATQGPAPCSLKSWGWNLLWGIAGSFLVFLTGSLVRLVHVIPYEQQEAVDESHQRVLTTVNRHISVVSSIRESPPIFQILSSYATQNTAHLLQEPQELTIEDYLYFLKESTNVATHHVFATSLLLPCAWVSDPEYRRYLALQSERRVLIPTLRIERVFVCKKAEFDGDPGASKLLVDLHRKAGISVGLCDEQEIERLNPEYCRDFVLFEAGETKWVLDAGVIDKNASPRQRIKFRVRCDPKDLNNFFSSMVPAIRDRTHWMYRKSR